jgi:hypothetical protein
MFGLHVIAYNLIRLGNLLKPAMPGGHHGLRSETLEINGVTYVTRARHQAGMRQAAEQRATLSPMRLAGSLAVRRWVGVALAAVASATERDCAGSTITSPRPQRFPD